MSLYQAFDVLWGNQHIPDSIEEHNSAAYVNALVAVQQGLQRTDELQRQTLSTQARQAINSYLASNRYVDVLNPPMLCHLPFLKGATLFVKVVQEQPKLSFADHALFPLWVLLLGDGLSLHLH